MACRFGFIGLGKYGGGLVQGIVNSNYPNKLAIYDINPRVYKQFTDKNKLYICQSIAELAGRSDIIILGVPGVDNCNAIVQEVNQITKSKIAVVFMDNFGLSAIKKASNVKKARIMFNFPVCVNSGIIGIYRNDLNRRYYSELYELLLKVGIVYRLEKEDQIVAMRVTAGASIGLMLYFMDSIVEEARAIGLPSAALEKLQGNIFKGLSSLFMAGWDSGGIKNKIASPGISVTNNILKQLNRKHTDRNVRKAIKDEYEKRRG